MEWLRDESEGTVNDDEKERDNVEFDFMEESVLCSPKSFFVTPPHPPPPLPHLFIYEPQ